MGNPVKAAKRSRRALGKLAEKTADRMERVLTNPSMPANDLTEEVLTQFFDGVEAMLGILRSFAGEPPTVLLDADITGNAAATPTATVDLDDPVAAIGNLTATTLTSPDDSLNMTLESVPPAAIGEIDRIKIKVAVPGNQTTGLYGGFVAMGQAIQVRVFVWVHA